ncbi:5598_t:CDS:2, partial [Acaulospora morrowiae]
VDRFTSSITINKNSIHGDVNMVAPGGVRIGTPALTSRSFKEEDFLKVAEFLHRAVQIALRVQEKAGSKMMKDFVMACQDVEEISTLKNEVEVFATGFPMPGFDPSNLTPTEA